MRPKTKLPSKGKEKMVKRPQPRKKRRRKKLRKSPSKKGPWYKKIKLSRWRPNFWNLHMLSNNVLLWPLFVRLTIEKLGLHGRCIFENWLWEINVCLDSHDSPRKNNTKFIKLVSRHLALLLLEILHNNIENLEAWPRNGRKIFREQSGTDPLGTNFT